MNADTLRLENLFLHVMNSNAVETMHDKGYADAQNEEVKRPQYGDSEYRKGWALGSRFKGNK
jgi:hypothetical protein